ncbi:MAG: hypothetical protein ABIT01_09840, partial [Thermoanaerobaculia bacterium]
NSCAPGSAIRLIDGGGAVTCEVIPSVPPPATPGQLIPFSSGIIINGSTMTDASPRLLGFGSNTVEVIDGSGESTMPPEAAGFSFPIAANGVISNLAVSTDLFVQSIGLINVIPLTYVFTVFRSSSVPSNGTAHVASPYITTSFTTSVTFGGPSNSLIASTFYAATSIAAGPLAVSAGDRIGIRVRTALNSNPSASDVSQVSFSASLSYVPN